MLTKKWSDGSGGDARTRAFISGGLAVGAGSTTAISVGWDALWMTVLAIIAVGWLGMVAGWLVGDLSERKDDGPMASATQELRPN